MVAPRHINPAPLARLLSVAPMMDWTDRHCRYFHRLLSQRALLYTEMVTTGALIHGDIPRHLAYDEFEHPVALQLGGSEPQDLAHCAQLGQEWGYDEINLNCGCPSERVQRGAFGACLMLEPHTVSDCVKAMKDRVSIPVTVKHRIGVDRFESYGFVRDFVGQVALAGCEVFIVHARSAWLKGLSPKENREIPPLRYEVLGKLKADFPNLQFIVNGGVEDNAHIEQFLTQGSEVWVGLSDSGDSGDLGDLGHLSDEPRGKEDVDFQGPIDGVMVGRAAYHTPYMLSEWDNIFEHHSKITTTHGVQAPELSPEPLRTREEVELAYVEYMHKTLQEMKANPKERSNPNQTASYQHMSRHMLGLWHGQAGARRWRQVWSDPGLKHESVFKRMELATQARLNASVIEAA